MRRFVDLFRARNRHTRILNPWLACLLLLMLALAIRLYRIDAQSLWVDEGNSVAIAQRSLIRIAQYASHDIHPPLYYWTLHPWVRLTGLTVFAVRALSAFYGTLVVALTYVLGRRWFGARAALIVTVDSSGCRYGQAHRQGAIA